MIKDALISECGLFRYYLLRIWDSAGPILFFVLLNPSKADASVDDATSKKCGAFADALGFGGFCILNMFALRSTKPEGLLTASDPIGPLNDTITHLMLRPDDTVICGWGANARRPALRFHAQEFYNRLRMTVIQPYALRLLSDGVPEHPLYLPGNSKLIRI